MTKLLNNDRKTSVIVDQFDHYDWLQLFNAEPEGYSWREEAYLAGDDYIEEGKEFLRSN
jgi:hypothetical protein